jgi:hypothetical protein
VVSRHSDEAKQIVAALLAMHGRTYCDELAINIARNTPSVLFRWLCATLLFSARINASVAIAAARAITRRGWTSARKMAASTWEERTHVLNAAGYARYDESTSAKLAKPRPCCSIDMAAICVVFAKELAATRRKSTDSFKNSKGSDPSARISSVVRYRLPGRSSILLPIPSRSIQPND